MTLTPYCKLLILLSTKSIYVYSKIWMIYKKQAVFQNCILSIPSTMSEFSKPKFGL